LGRAHLLLNHFLGTLPESTAHIVILEKFQQDIGQMLRLSDADRLGTPKNANDVAEVFGVRSDNGGNSPMRGFEDVVTASRNQAATHNRYIGEGIDRGKFAE
jgi:hypothetical protein